MEKFVVTSNWTVKVKSVEVDRETESSVFINGRRLAKRSSYDNYFDSFQEAKDFCIAIGERKLAVARRQLQEANSYFGNAKGLKNPSTTASAAPPPVV